MLVLLDGPLHPRIPGLGRRCPAGWISQDHPGPARGGADAPRHLVDTVRGVPAATAQALAEQGWRADARDVGRFGAEHDQARPALLAQRHQGVAVVHSLALDHAEEQPRGRRKPLRPHAGRTLRARAVVRGVRGEVEAGGGAHAWNLGLTGRCRTRRWPARPAGASAGPPASRETAGHQRLHAGIKPLRVGDAAHHRAPGSADLARRLRRALRCGHARVPGHALADRSRALGRGGTDLPGRCRLEGGGAGRVHPVVRGHGPGGATRREPAAERQGGRAAVRREQGEEVDEEEEDD